MRHDPLTYHTARLLAMLRVLPLMRANDPAEGWTKAIVGHARLAAHAARIVLDTEDQYGCHQENCRAGTGRAMKGRIPSIYPTGDGTYTVENRAAGECWGRGLTQVEAEEIVARETALQARVDASMTARRRPQHGVRDDTDLSGF